MTASRPSIAFTIRSTRNAASAAGAFCGWSSECRRHGQPYVYLGYWIADSPKMAYKARFPALERLTADGWTGFAPPPEAGAGHIPRPACGERAGGEGANGDRTMAIGILNSAIFADMFGTPAMRAVFADLAFLARCAEVEAALARAQARLGIIPAEAAAAITKAAAAIAERPDRSTSRA